MRSPSVDEAEEPELPARSIEVQIDGRMIRGRLAKLGLSDLQTKVIEAYYSPAGPSLPKVAELLELPLWKVAVAHAEALQILRSELKAA